MFLRESIFLATRIWKVLETDTMKLFILTAEFHIANKLQLYITTLVVMTGHYRNKGACLRELGASLAVKMLKENLGIGKRNLWER